MEEAIKIAIDNNWLSHLHEYTYRKIDDTTYYFEVKGSPLPGYQRSVFTILLDPLFWQALGKGFGWEKTDYCWGCGYDEGATIDTDGWKIKMHHFIDHLASGGDIESFFTNLIK